MGELKVIEFPKKERDEPTIENLMGAVEDYCYTGQIWKD